MTDRELFIRACDALERAYAPYSHFSVGACILTEDGRTFQGCNIENASFGATICAERAAVSAAVSQGAQRFIKVAIAGKSAPAWPCGICRQVLYEFGGGALQVICGAADTGAFEALQLASLLPHAFGPNSL